MISRWCGLLTTRGSGAGWTRRGALMAAALATSAASAPPAADTPVPLWGGLASGMNQAQVHQVYPAAALSREAQDDSGYLTTLAVPLPTLYGQPALARFRFRNRQLVAVRLDARNLKPAHRRDNIARVHALIKAYSLAHPDVYDCKDNSFADTADLDCKWVDKGLTIQLEYMDVAGQAPLLKVVYSPTADVGPDL